MASNLQSVHVQLGIAIWLAVVLLLLGLVAVLWHYRGTNPATARSLRRVLAVLRVAVFLTTVAMLGTLLVQWTRVQRVAPRVLILHDVSLSMRYVEGKRPRWQRSEMVVKQLEDLLSRKVVVQHFAFGTGLRRLVSPIQDSTQVADESTDLAGALSALEDSLVSAETIGVVLVSDGAYNRGADPATVAGRLGVPVWSVCVGDSTVPRDVSVAEVPVPEIALVGQPVSVHARIRYSGIDGAEAVSVVLQNAAGRILKSKTLKLSPERVEVESALTFVPEDTGLARLRISVRGLAGEVSLRNNSAEAFLRVLPGVHSLLLLGGAPSPDLGFLGRELASDSGFSIITVYELRPGKLSRQLTDSLLRNVQGCILVDFPARWSSPQVAKGILSNLRATKKPLIVFAGNGFNWREFRAYFPELVPKNIRRSGGQTVDVTLADGAALHPLIQVSDYSQVTRDAWSNVAPVRAPWIIGSVPDSCGPLLFGKRGSSRATVLGWVNETHGLKAALFAMAGFWRWRLAPIAYGREPVAYRAFVRNLGAWLVAPHGVEGLEVAPEQMFFEGGAPVAFRARLYDLGLRPVNNALVTVKIKRARGDDELTLLLDGAGNGSYRGMVSALPAGPYEFRAVAQAGDRVWGPVEGSFVVKPFVAELSDLRARPEVLRRVAKASGGTVCVDVQDLRPVLGSILDALDRFDKKMLREERTGSWSVKTSYWLLAFLLILLTTEWTLRRRHGLL